MDHFTHADLNELLDRPRPPCISIYMPSHRGGGKEATIDWRNCVNEADVKLADWGWPEDDRNAILRPTRILLADADFWKNQGDGLAAFLAPKYFRVFRLPRAFPHEVVVAERFSVVTLLPLLNGDGTFFVLALSQNAPRLYRGSRDTFEDVAIENMPANLDAALLAHDRDEPLNLHTRPTSGGSFGAIFHGHGVGIDDRKDDLTRYFRTINAALRPYLRDKKAPLLLAAVEYLHPLYANINTYAHLLDSGLRGNPDHLKRAELHDRAWQLVRPLFEREQTRAVEKYKEMAGTSFVSSDVPTICSAAMAGRIETLFVNLDRPVWGAFEPSTGRLEQRDAPLPGGMDLRNLAVTSAFARGRNVYGVSTAAMPGGTEMAATFFYPLPKHGPRKRR